MAQTYELPEETRRVWRVVRFVVLAAWVVAGLLAARVLLGTMADDVDHEDPDVLVEQVEELGR